MLRLIDGNNVFRRRFETLGSTALTNLFYQAAYIPLGVTQIWVWDAKGAKDRRRKVYPNYKLGRVKASDEFYQTVRLFQTLLTHSKSMQLTVPTYEADDVIATLALGTAQPVVIDSNDFDFASLSCARIKVEMDSKLPCTPKDTRLYKTLVGDKSDAIPGFVGFGQKSFEKLTAAEKDLLIRILSGGPPTLISNFGRFSSWTESLTNRFIDDVANLRIYWKIIELLDVPLDEIPPNIIHPTLNIGKANSIFKDLFLPTI